jgi:hypothetical protein
MVRSPADLSGFYRSDEPVASPCLLRAVAASLVLAACLSVGLTVISIKVAMALPGLG